jgi:secondary thiamine-phosphate synthase enzyme
VTTIEYESGVVADVRQVLGEVVPAERDWQHNQRAGDDNGHSHVRAALVGPSLTVPFAGGRLTLGTWQQIVFLDFDTGPRTRRLVLQILGEP